MLCFTKTFAPVSYKGCYTNINFIFCLPLSFGIYNVPFYNKNILKFTNNINYVRLNSEMTYCTKTCPVKQIVCGLHSVKLTVLAILMIYRVGLSCLLENILG